MAGWPHKSPARAGPAVPSPPPKLKSTLPLEQGGWVAWQHGASEPHYMVPSFPTHAPTVSHT